MPNILSLEQLQQQKSDFQNKLDDFFKEENLGSEEKVEKIEELKLELNSLKREVEKAIQGDQENQEQYKKLQEDLIALEQQYDDILLGSQKEMAALGSGVENERYGTIDLITLKMLEGTPLKTTMLSVLSKPEFNNIEMLKGITDPEKRLEVIFRKINTVLARFYARKLNLSAGREIPDYLSKVIIPATEWFLMDILRQSGHETNVNFLGEITEIGLDNFSDLFKGIQSFSDKFTIPFTQGKSLLYFADFISLPKNNFGLKKLKNPYEFYEKVLQNTIWQSITTSEKNKDQKIPLNDITWEEFQLSDLSGEDNRSQLEQQLIEGKARIQEDLGSIQMVDSPETVQKLIGVLEKTDHFFESSEQIGNALLDKMDVFGDANRTLKSALGFDLWKEIRNIPLLGGILDFVLGILGFSGGVEGLERSWKKRKLDKVLGKKQKEYIQETFEAYMEGKAIDQNTVQNLMRTYRLKVDDDQVSKFGIDLPLIKGEINEKIKNNPELINLSTLKNISVRGKFKGSDFVETVKEGSRKVLKLKKELSSEELEIFVDAYLTETITHIAHPKQKDALKYIQDADSLAFILISGIAVEKENALDGLEAGFFLPSHFYEFKDRDDPEVTGGTPVEIQGYSGELIFNDKIPGDKQAFQNKLEEISSNLNINPNRLMALMNRESGINPQAQNAGTNATGLIQFMPTTALNLGTNVDALKSMSAVDQLSFVEKYFQGNEYSGLKDLYLKTFFPIALQYSSNPDYIFSSDTLSASAVAAANPAIARGKSEITMQDFNNYIEEIIANDVPQEYRNQFT